jgi:hypothetical protein
VRSRTGTTRRLLVVGVAGVAGCLLSSCGSHPGEAAVVGSQSISESRVDAVAAALCSAQAAAKTALSSRAARQGALDVLVQSSLSRQFAAARHATPDAAATSKAVASQQQTLDQLPASRRSAFRSVLQEYAEGQLGLATVGARALAQAGTAKVTQDQALAEGQRLRNAWVPGHVKVSVDPRFGRFSKLRLVGGSGSLSVPQSTSAVAGANGTPASSWVASLPASQQCG